MMNRSGARSPTPVLPMIDVAPLRDGDAAARRRGGEQLRDACRQRGFFYVTGHGVDAALIDAVFAQSARLFALDDAAKAALDKAHSSCNRGYEPLRNQVLEAGAPPDLKEGFYLGVELPEGDPRVLAGKFNHGPNQWPDGLPGFRPTMERYFEQMLDLGALLMRGLALSLALPERYFDPFLDRAMATLRLLHYPPQPAQPAPGEKGCGEHTDFGSVTLLLQDEVGGLQVRDAAGGWIDAPPIPGSYVVNIGDLIARWTNGHYHSTLHRVINRSGRERYSVPFFLTGAPDHEVACLPTCLDDGEAPRFAPITVAEHLAECYRRTYG
jgi:isopenicillin N synthase-like dioxygenase